jgi:hypothetical protein
VFLRIALLALLLLLPAAPASAQSEDEQAENTSSEGAQAESALRDMPFGAAPSIQAVATDTPPVLDGNVLDDAAWSGVAPFGQFTQVRPDEGAPASERTEVRIQYTPTTMYVGVVAYDSDPSQIIIADSRRDANLQDTDSFSFILDTYQDRQNGFIFGTNPAGIEYDAQVSNEGQGGGGFGGGPRSQGGSGGGLNVNWDGSWIVRAVIGDFGWSAEFAIPMTTLRFDAGLDQVWGVNFERRIRRRTEVAYWAPLPRQYNLPRVSLAGTLEGLNLTAPRNLQITPYVLGQGARDSDARLATDRVATTGPDADFGVDLKYSLTPSVTLDATYNTDFAQVEVDEQQINLDRFNLFFPEKRPFFLENAGVFSVGQPGEIELFFSRRIGIAPGGGAVPILGGARVSGTVGAFRVGLLNMQTEQVGGLNVPGNNFGVARIKRELPNRTFVGALFTNRQGVGDLSTGSDHNRLFALDGQVGIGRYGLLSGFAARSFTPSLSGNEYAFRFNSEYDSEEWRLNAGYTEVAENFNPEVGFLQRFAYRRADGLVFRTFRPDFLGFHEIRPHVSYTGYWGFDGLYESGFLHVDSHWEWQNGYEIHTGINFTDEGVRSPFEISDGVTVPEGEYSHREAMIVGNTDESRKVSLSMRLEAGGFFGGDRVTLSPTLRLRTGEAFNSEFSLSRNHIDIPDGSFTANLLRARLSYSFTPRLYVQSLLQYNDSIDLWSANLRLGWLHTAGTGLFVVFNHTTDFDRALGYGAFDPTLTNQTLIIKYSRLINVL